MLGFISAHQLEPMGDWQFSSCLGLGFEKSQLGCSFQPFSLPESPGAVLVWMCISGEMDTGLEPDLGDTDDQLSN